MTPAEEWFPDVPLTAEEEAYFNQLYDEHYTFIYDWWFIHTSEDADLADEAARGSFVALWKEYRKTDVWPDGLELSAFLRKAARNAAFNARDARQRKWDRDEAAGAEIDTEVATPLAVLIGDEKMARFEAALAAQSPKARTAIVLRLGGSSNVEIAVKLGSKPNSVAKLVRETAVAMNRLINGGEDVAGNAWPKGART